jgi:hypothetical protein
MMMPCLAASEMAPITATGMEISSGQGVAITTTARKRIASPVTTQAATATPTAIGVYHAPSLSPSRRRCGRFCYVSCITRMILA